MGTCLLLLWKNRSSNNILIQYLISFNHGQIIWDEHVKNNIFFNISHILHKVDPLPRNNVDVHLNYHGKNCDTTL